MSTDETRGSGASTAAATSAAALSASPIPVEPPSASPIPGASDEPGPGSAPGTSAPPLRLGFARGTAPGKWAKRWREAGGGPLELVAVEATFGREGAVRPVRDRGARPRAHEARDPAAPADPAVDVMLERTRPGERPDGADGDART
ncbi:MAG: hypothetical protein QM606_01415, partial [Leucobacter sp.]